MYMFTKKRKEVTINNDLDGAEAFTSAADRGSARATGDLRLQALNRTL